MIDEDYLIKMSEVMNDYYFKINEVSPSGEFTGKSIDSDMVN